MHSYFKQARLPILITAVLSIVNVAFGADLNIPVAAWPKFEFPRIPPAQMNLPAMQLPIEDFNYAKLRSQFLDRRRGHTHQAIDLMNPRGTPVVAVTDGYVKKLYRSKKGGISVYLFDAKEQLCFFYGHLDKYVKGLVEGMKVTPGQVLGFVGSTGNAKKSSPHLHFAISEVGPDKKWSGGKAIDPLPVLLGAHAEKFAYDEPRSSPE